MPFLVTGFVLSASEGRRHSSLIFGSLGLSLHPISHRNENNVELGGGGVVHSCIPSTQGVEAVDSELEAGLGYK